MAFTICAADRFGPLVVPTSLRLETSSTPAVDANCCIRMFPKTTRLDKKLRLLPNGTQTPRFTFNCSDSVKLTRRASEGDEESIARLLIAACSDLHLSWRHSTKCPPPSAADKSEWDKWTKEYMDNLKSDWGWRADSRAKNLSAAQAHAGSPKRFDQKFDFEERGYFGTQKSQKETSSELKRS